MKYLHTMVRVSDLDESLIRGSLANRGVPVIHGTYRELVV